MKTIGIYPGNFQPPHKGHYEAYKKLKQIAGPDTFVVTTDYDPTTEATLHYGDKEQILVRHGVPDSHIRKVKNLNNPVEVLENFDPETTVVIYALSQRGAADKINSSNYYKPFQGSQLRPFKYNSYILIVDDIHVKDKNGKVRVFSSKNIREALGSYRFTTKQKQTWFKLFFDWFDLGLFELLKNKYTNAHQSDVFEPPPDDIKEVLSKEILKMLNELMGLPPSIATDPSYGDSNSIATDQQDTTKDNTVATKSDLVQQKKQAEDEKQQNLSQYNRDKDSVHNFDKYKRKQDQAKIDNLNKQITQTPTSTNL